MRPLVLLTLIIAITTSSRASDLRSYCAGFTHPAGRFDLSSYTFLSRPDLQFSVRVFPEDHEEVAELIVRDSQGLVHQMTFHLDPTGTAYPVTGRLREDYRKTGFGTFNYHLAAVILRDRLGRTLGSDDSHLMSSDAKALWIRLTGSGFAEETAGARHRFNEAMLKDAETYGLFRQWIQRNVRIETLSRSEIEGLIEVSPVFRHLLEKHSSDSASEVREILLSQYHCLTRGLNCIGSRLLRLQRERGAFLPGSQTIPSLEERIFESARKRRLLE